MTDFQVAHSIRRHRRMRLPANASMFTPCLLQPCLLQPCLLPLCLLALCVSMFCGCTTDGDIKQRGRFSIVLESINGAPVPPLDKPLKANLGDKIDRWTFSVEAINNQGQVDQLFQGFARVSVIPGAVERITGPSGRSRNLVFVNGRASGTAELTASFGLTRLWIQDIGYKPAAQGQIPLCSNGLDDDGDVLNDFPADPGCAFANDMTEEAGTLLTGVSDAVPYDLPTVAEVQGLGRDTAYPSVAVEVRSRPNELVVTRVASNGFFLTDLSDPSHPKGYNHIFAFSFNTPSNMRVCDKLSYLTGTASEFFGFTEIAFPSYEIGEWDKNGTTCQRDHDCDATSFCRRRQCQPCRVPEPVTLDAATLANNDTMERLESGLVRIKNYRIATLFGPNFPAVSGAAPNFSYAFSASASNCDLDQNGAIDFFDDLEGGCSDACAENIECTDWIGFSSRGNYKVNLSAQGGSGDGCRRDSDCKANEFCTKQRCQQKPIQLMINTSTAGGFMPTRSKGKRLEAVTGTLRHFAGGSLNWTIDTRCNADLVCDFDDACSKKLANNMACSVPPTDDDNDAGTN